MTLVPPRHQALCVLQAQQHAFREKFREKAPFSYTDPEPYRSLSKVGRAMPGQAALLGSSRQESHRTALSPGQDTWSLTEPFSLFPPATEEHCCHGERHGRTVQVSRAV